MAVPAKNLRLYLKDLSVGFKTALTLFFQKLNIDSLNCGAKNKVDVTSLVNCGRLKVSVIPNHALVVCPASLLASFSATRIHQEAILRFASEERPRP